MCVMCFNSQWRSVLIGSTGASLALAVVWITAVYQDEVELYLGLDLKKFGCLAVDQDETSTWTWKMNNKHCVLLFFWACFPIPLWLVLAGYVVNHVVLAIGAGISHSKMLITFLYVDAIYLIMMATFLLLAMFPSGLTRICLLTILFPAFAVSLVCWMSVFGFHLKLQERQRRERKRMEVVRQLQAEWRRRKMQRKLEGFTNFGFV